MLCWRGYALKTCLRECMRNKVSKLCFDGTHVRLNKLIAWRMLRVEILEASWRYNTRTQTQNDVEKQVAFWQKWELFQVKIKIINPVIMRTYEGCPKWANAIPIAPTAFSCPIIQAGYDPRTYRTALVCHLTLIWDQTDFRNGMVTLINVSCTFCNFYLCCNK